MTDLRNMTYEPYGKWGPRFVAQVEIREVSDGFTEVTLEVVGPMEQIDPPWWRTAIRVAVLQWWWRLEYRFRHVGV